MLDQNSKWIATGMTYEKVKHGNNSVTESITIPDSGTGITMSRKSKKSGKSEKSRKIIFGMPIDGQLAVFYIRKLWTIINHERLLDFQTKFNVNLDNVLGNKKKPPFTGEKFEQSKQELIDQSNWSVGWIKELLNQSAAITIDKNCLLKTLSQPECEGMRFYLCMKDRPHKWEGIDKEDIAFYPDELKDKMLTFATVGVNKHGEDLQYSNLHPKLRDENEIPDIENCSLCLEYSHTSGKLCAKNIANSDLAPYTLYNYAMPK